MHAQHIILTQCVLLLFKYPKNLKNLGNNLFKAVRVLFFTTPFLTYNLHSEIRIGSYVQDKLRDRRQSPRCSTTIHLYLKQACINIVR